MTGHATPTATLAAPGQRSPSVAVAVSGLRPPSVADAVAVTASPRAGRLAAQWELSGGSDPFVLAALATFLLAVVLAVAVTYRFVEGYRSTGSRPILLLAVGMFLLAPAPMFLRLLLGNVTLVEPVERQLLTRVSELAGLLAILWVVFRR